MRIAITGGTGTLGSVLTRMFAETYDKVVVVSRDEYKQWQCEKDAGENVRFVLCDVRDKCRLQMIFREVDVVVHAAALKQIDRCEYNPTEAIETNVNGTANVVRACLNAGVKKAVFVSTDKAVNPVNLYGATKLCGEKLFLAANAFNSTVFSVVRYGNVLNSRGSIVEKVEECKINDEAVPLTDVRMTRFWMTKESAGMLVQYAIDCEDVGVFVPTVKSCSVHKLCREIYPKCEFRHVGIRLGEKVHESLCADEQEVWLVDEDFQTHKKHVGVLSSK